MPWSGCWLLKGVFPLSFRAFSLCAPFPSSFNAFTRGPITLCARLLQETLTCFPYAVSFLHYCQFTYVCLSSLLSSLPSKQQELHQHPLQGRAQVSSEALKGFLNLDGTFLSNYFFLYCLTQDQGTFVHPESSSESFTETGVSTLLI